MKDFEENHLAHSAVIGGLTALVLNRNGSDNRNSIVAGSIVSALSYWYMRKYGHGLPRTSEPVVYSAVM